LDNNKEVIFYSTDPDCCLKNITEDNTVNTLEYCVKDMLSNNIDVWCGGYLVQEQAGNCNNTSNNIREREKRLVTKQDIVLREIVFKENSYFAEQNTAVKLKTCFNFIPGNCFGSLRREMETFLKPLREQKLNFRFVSCPVITSDSRPTREGQQKSLAYDQSHMNLAVIKKCLSQMTPQLRSKELHCLSTILEHWFLNPMEEMLPTDRAWVEEKISNEFVQQVLAARKQLEEMKSSKSSL